MSIWRTCHLASKIWQAVSQKINNNYFVNAKISQFWSFKGYSSSHKISTTEKLKWWWSLTIWESFEPKICNAYLWNFAENWASLNLMPFDTPYCTSHRKNKTSPCLGQEDAVERYYWVSMKKVPPKEFIDTKSTRRRHQIEKMHKDDPMLIPILMWVAFIQLFDTAPPCATFGMTNS